MIKQFLSLIRQFIPPYRKYLFSNLALNLLAQVLNVFSFALLIACFKKQKDHDGNEGIGQGTKLSGVDL